MEDYLKQILSELLLTPKAKATSNPEQIHVRCRMPDCGDSNNPNSAHMYVGVSRRDPTKLGYECKKCSASGYVDEKFLTMYDIDPSRYVEYFKNRTGGIRKTYDMNNNKRIDLKIPRTILPQDRRKVEYIERRLGRHITPDDINNMKIVLNLGQTLNFNKIDPTSLVQEPTPEKLKNLINEIDELSNHFFGFLSANNNRITMRNMGSSIFNEKYHVFTIDPSIVDPFIYYPKMSIDICTDSPEIIMAEGVFDILGVRERFYKEESNTNRFFVAVGGVGSYRRCLKSVLKMTGFLDATVRIYSDSDVSPEMYKKVFLEFSEYMKFEIVYNVRSKDFGDVQDDVETKYVRLKWER